MTTRIITAPRRATPLAARIAVTVAVWTLHLSRERRGAAHFFFLCSVGARDVDAFAHDDMRRS